MKILIVSCFGTSRSVGKITTLQYEYLKKKGHDVRVCYRGFHEPHISNKDYVRVAPTLEVVIGRAVAQYTGFEGCTHPLATRKLISFTKDFNPDIVQINLLHGYYINSNKFLSFLKDSNIRTSYTMFDEYAYMGKCAFSFECNNYLYGCNGKCPHIHNYPVSKFFDRSKFIWVSKKKVYDSFEKIIFSGTKWVADRAKQSALLRKHRIVELDEPIDFSNVFCPQDTIELRKKLNIPAENKVIVTVAQLSDPRKGGKYVFEVAKRLLEFRDITFVFVGCNVPGPFHLDNLIQIPFVKSQKELALYYSLGDLFICTSLADTTPCVCIDSLGCGTPLAGFAEAGTPTVCPPEYGIFTPTYDIEALAKVIIESPKKTPERINACRKYALQRYAPEIVIKKLEGIYKELINM